MLSTGLYAGFDTPVFAVSAILAIVVMHDAMNVRLESGKQAHLLNVMADTFEKVTEKTCQTTRNSKASRTYTAQVAAGCALGLLIAVIVRVTG